MIEEANSDDAYTPLYDFDIGRKLTQRMMKAEELPTAIFACNDMMAFGVIHELSQQQIKVPEDISVMGFDGIDFGQMMNPQLTTIKQPDYEMGRMACKMLLDIMNGENKPVFDIMLQPRLIERGSVNEIKMVTRR
jgi:LacI family transcriptional regulator